MGTGARLFRVLVVEDNEGDIELLHEAVSSDGAPIELIIMNKGIQAWKWLEAGHEVDLVLTDLNMPGMSGIERIGHMRQHLRLSAVPVILTSSTAENCLPKTCSLEGGATYFEKAHTWAGYLQLVRELVAVLRESPARPPEQVAERIAGMYRTPLPGPSVTGV